MIYASSANIVGILITLVIVLGLGFYSYILIRNHKKELKEAQEKEEARKKEKAERKGKRGN